MASKAAVKSKASEQTDLYQVLGIAKTATTEEIKSAYRKLALRHHPDKASEANREAAVLRFQELTAAYNVLSDHNKRAKYDSQGFSALEPSELDVEIDVSSLGIFSTFAAAMFTKLGVPLKTSVPASIIEQAFEGRFTAKRMKIGDTFSDKVEKGQAQFYDLEISEQDIEQGFVLGVHSKMGSKFKVLLFEAQGNKSWELNEQEDSEFISSSTSIASFFFVADRTYKLAPKNSLEAASNPENQLFTRLESLMPRDNIRIKPGICTFAVYNDNWFKRAQFTVTALMPSKQPEAKVALTDMKSAEDNLLDLQSSIRAFQSEYRQAQERWRAAVEKHKQLSLDVEEHLAVRGNAHLKMLCSGQK